MKTKYKWLSKIKERRSIIKEYRKPKVSQKSIFTRLVSNALLEEKKKKFFMQNFIERKNHLDILREELSKKIGNEKMMADLPKEERRDIFRIELALYQIGEMKKFLDFQGITHTAFSRAALYMQYKKFKKGEYIFKQGDKPDNFYGVISGTISLIYHYIDIEEKDDDGNPVEKTIERLKINSGRCFGEWALIFKKARTTDALCITDVEVFYIKEPYFTINLGKEILREDNTKKDFITRKLPGIQVNSIRYILSSVVPLFFDKNDIVYRDGDPAEFIYVVYQGELSCKKYLGNNPEYIHDLNMVEDLFKIVPGCIIGLETISEHKFHKTYLIARKNFTVVYKISPQILKKFHYDSENLIALYEKQEIALAERIDSIKTKKEKRFFTITKIEKKNIFDGESISGEIIEPLIINYIKKRRDNSVNKEIRAVKNNVNVINYKLISSLYDNNNDNNENDEINDYEYNEISYIPSRTSTNFFSKKYVKRNTSDSEGSKKFLIKANSTFSDKAQNMKNNISNNNRNINNTISNKICRKKNILIDKNEEQKSNSVINVEVNVTKRKSSQQNNSLFGKEKSRIKKNDTRIFLSPSQYSGSSIGRYDNLKNTPKNYDYFKDNLVAKSYRDNNNNNCFIKEKKENIMHINNNRLITEPNKAKTIEKFQNKKIFTLSNVKDKVINQKACLYKKLLKEKKNNFLGEFDGNKLFKELKKNIPRIHLEEYRQDLEDFVLNQCKYSQNKERNKFFNNPNDLNKKSQLINKKIASKHNCFFVSYSNNNNTLQNKNKKSLNSGYFSLPLVSRELSN